MQQAKSESKNCHQTTLLQTRAGNNLMFGKIQRFIFEVLPQIKFICGFKVNISLLLKYDLG